MRKIKEVLRLRAQGLSDREISESLGIGRATVSRYRTRAQRAGLTWPLPAEISETELDAKLFPPAPPAGTPRPLPEWKHVREELRRPGVTLQLLWLEYRQAHPDGYQYSRFCELYRSWEAGLDPVLRQEHKAGEKVFVDYAGQTVPIVTRETGEVREAQVFVGVLGASNFTFAEATWTQSLPDWTGSHVRMLEYFGGVPELVVPDNLRAGVSRACRYDPDVNPSYQELASHYGMAVVPARPGKPRDKAKAEAGVLVTERWILAPLRDHTFFGLNELNEQVSRLRDALNDRPFQKLEGSRRSLFETLERPLLRPLPATRYEFAEWRKARANIDYHIAVDNHLYSVPHQLVGEQVDVRLTATTVEALRDGRRVAAHARSYQPGRHTTDPGHRPKAHEKHLEWTPSRIVKWAESKGPHTATLVGRILASKPHPEQGYRACLGILRLGERYSVERLEAACARALTIGGISYRSVNSILTNGLDRVPLDDDEQTTLDLPQTHENVRGPDYYTSWN